MKRIFWAVFILCILYSTGWGQPVPPADSQTTGNGNVPAEENGALTSSGGIFGSTAFAQQTQTDPSPFRRFYIGGAASLLNVYQRGNVDEFWQNTLSDPNAVPNDGSTAFFDLQAGFVTTPNEGKDWFGPELRMMVPVEYAIQGRDLYYGGRNDLYFSGMIFGAMLTYQHALDQNRTVLLVLEPGFDFMTMSGQLSTQYQNLNFQNGYGYGGHFAAGANIIVGSIFGLTFRGGYRFMQVDARYADESSDTGYSQPHVAGEGSALLTVDWSGPYAQFGLIILL